MSGRYIDTSRLSQNRWSDGPDLGVVTRSEVGGDRVGPTCSTVVGTGVGLCNNFNTFGSTLASGQIYNKACLTFEFNTYLIRIILQIKLFGINFAF